MARPQSPVFSLWRWILVRLGRDPTWLHRGPDFGPPDMRPPPPTHRWSERVDLISDAEIDEMRAEAERSGIYIISPATGKMFPEFQPGDEVWEDHYRSSKRSVEGDMLLSDATSHCRLVRNGETIARKLHWIS